MNQISASNYSAIIKAIKEGKVVALPTETVYGLAIALNSATALEKLIYLKRRDLKSGKIFTLVPESIDAFEKYALIGKRAKEFINNYVPGEITLILNKNPEFKHPYFDNFNTVGLRLPKHPLFNKILEDTGPLLLTSANLRGENETNTSKEVAKILPKVDLIVAGESGKNPPSTIVNLTKSKPVIVRQGRLKVL